MCYTGRCRYENSRGECIRGKHVCPMQYDEEFELENSKEEMFDLREMTKCQPKS
jgi:hypothetical protein